MTPEQFSALAQQGYNRIPVMREVLADLDTPLSTYLKLANGPYSYLLESVHGGEKWGRYSIIGLPCNQILKVFGNTITIEEEGKIIEQVESRDPLDFIEKYQARFKVPELDGSPRFNGGLVGYFAYDTVRYIEPKLAKNCPEDPLGTPEILLMVSDQLVVFDNLSGKLMLIYHADPNIDDAYQLAQTVSAKQPKRS
jgi:anthranilate synthase component 1